MITTPGTVSKILWHFTGGPIWDDKKHKQSTHPKPVEQAYANIKSIIGSQELRLGNYKELIRVIVPRRRHTYSLFDDNDIPEHEPIELFSSPVCCIADIPIQHLNYHSARYGKIAIGFHRESVINHGFNPVLYTLEHSYLNNTIYDSFDLIEKVDVYDANNKLEDIGKEIEGQGEPDRITSSITSVQNSLYDIERTQNELSEYFLNILSYIKTFEQNDFDSIYCEREWRSTKCFKFTDPAIIIQIAA